MESGRAGKASSPVPGTYFHFARMTDCDPVADSGISWNAPLAPTAGYLRDDRDTKGCLGGLACSYPQQS